MNTGDKGQTETESTESIKTAQQKRSWVAPMLIPEDAKYATRGKINNTGEFVLAGTAEGQAS